MKKNKLNMVVAIALCVSLGLSSCIGSFKLTNKVLGWNEGVGNKFVNELVFIAFHIIPVYELTVVADTPSNFGAVKILYLNRQKK